MSGGSRPTGSAAGSSPISPPEPFASGPAHAWPRTAIEYKFSSTQEQALVDARPDAGECPAVRARHGVRRLRSMQAPASYSGADRGRGGGQRPAFRAGQLHALRLALRPSAEGDGPRHGRLLPHRRRDRAAAQSLAAGIRQQRHQQHRRTRARAFPWWRARSRSASGRPSPACLVASCACGRTISSTTSRRPSTSSPRSRHPSLTIAAGQEARMSLSVSHRMTSASAAAPSEAGRLFREGHLGEAIAAANAAVRSKPSDIAARVLLAELLAFAGNVERIDVVLDACADLDPSAALVVAEFRQLLRGEIGKAAIVRRRAPAGVPGRAHRGPAPRRWPPCGAARRRCGEAGRLAAQAEEARIHLRGHDARTGHSTTCATPTTCWPPASRSSPRPASTSGSRPSAWQRSNSIP